MLGSPRYFPRLLLTFLPFICLPSGVVAQTRPANPAARPPALTPASPSGALRMRVSKIMDAQGWGQPVEVARLLVPSGWRVEGGVQWAQNMTRCPQNIIQARWRASSPDGLTGFEILPQYSWGWSDDPLQQQTRQQSAANGLACDAYPVMNPADFLGRMVVPRIRQQSRIVGAEPLPGLARAEQQKLMAGYAPMIQQGLLRGVRAEAGRVRVQHTIGGQPGRSGSPPPLQPSPRRRRTARRS